MSGVEIELRGVTKTFDRSVEAVAPMDLDLRPGRVTALLGPTGCGKSTLLRMIGGVETPTAGSVALRPKPPLLPRGALPCCPCGGHTPRTKRAPRASATA